MFRIRPDRHRTQHRARCSRIRQHHRICIVHSRRRIIHMEQMPRERMMQMHRIAHTIMRIIRMHITTMHRQIRITQTYYTQATQQPTGANNNYYDNQVSGDVFDEVFVEKDERPVATLSNGLVLNLLSGEGLRNEQAVLTDKRLYYNHREGLINRISTREIINTDDITGTKITDNKPYSLLIWAALIFIGTLITSIQSDDSTAIVCGSIVAIVMVILFLVLIQKWLLVEYAGGRIRLSVKKYGMNNIIAFQKAIYRVKASSK